MQKKTKSFIGCLIILAYFIMFQASVAPRQTYKTSSKPGFYGVTSGWNNWSGDVNGEVGHRMYVSGPRAKCIHCNNCEAGSWSSNYSIESGRLPPGLSFGDGFDISGIPTERGHWVIKLKLYNIKCNNAYYGNSDFTQELRFHITGTGKVNN